MAVPAVIPHLDEDRLKKVRVNEPAVMSRVSTLAKSRPLNEDRMVSWLLRAIACIDLTSLGGNDTAGTVQRLCHKACNPIDSAILSSLGLNGCDATVCRAVCIYPARVLDCVTALKFYDPKSRVRIASVAAGFPSGQYPLESRLVEIRSAVADGATEIDVVINRGLALVGNWKGVYDELVQMRAACAGVHMKSIIAAGELGSLTNVYRASLVAMMAGSDFIKTSTGKETVNATLPIGLVMARAIREFHMRTGRKVGFKPAGGIRTYAEALSWLVLMKEELGDDWLHPNLFSIGSSTLVDDIERKLLEIALKRPPALANCPTDTSAPIEKSKWMT